MKRMILALVLFIVLALTNSVVVFADELNKLTVTAKLTAAWFSKPSCPPVKMLSLDNTYKTSFGHISASTLATYDYGSFMRYDLRFYPCIKKEQLFTVGIGYIYDDFKLSSKNTSYAALNIIQPLKWGKATGCIFIQPRLNISGGMDQIIVKEASLKFPLGPNLKIGPDFQATIIEGSRSVFQPGGVLEYKVSDHLSAKLRYFPKNGTSEQEVQPWVSWTF